MSARKKNSGGPSPSSNIAPMVKSTNDGTDLEMELRWCIHRLEESLDSKQLSRGQKEDVLKKIRQLRSTNVPIPKKRLIMKATFGNYRERMRTEENEFKLVQSDVKFTTEMESKSRGQHIFVKKVIRPDKKEVNGVNIMEKEVFKFNFPIDANCITNGMQDLQI